MQDGRGGCKGTRGERAVETGAEGRGGVAAAVEEEDGVGVGVGGGDGG